MARTAKNDNADEKLRKNRVIGEIQDAEVEDISFEEAQELAEGDHEEDIFEDICDPLVRGGDRITYKVNKNGQFVEGSVPHPFNYKGLSGWSAIQRKYGEGTYQVTARSTSKNAYVKSQSKSIGALPYDEEEEPRRDAGSTTAELLAQLNEQKRQDQQAMEEREERRERERRETEERREQERKDRDLKAELDRKEREKEVAASGNQTMMLMMKMLETQSAQTTALLSGLLTGSKKEPEINIERLIDKMEQRMEKTIQMFQGKDKTKEIDALTLIDMQSKAEERGYKRAMDIQDQAERKADEIAEMRENVVNPGAKDTGGATKAIVDAVMPAMQMFLASRGVGGIEQPVVAAPQANVPTVQSQAPRNTVAAPVNGINPNRPAVPYRGPVVPRRAPVVVAPAPQTQQKPKEQFTQNVKSTPVKDQPVDKKAVTETIVVDLIGQDLKANYLAGKLNPEKTAQLALEKLKMQGIDKDWLYSAYTLDDMLKLAKAKGLPDQIAPYIERFYARICKSESESESENPVETNPNSEEVAKE